MRGCFFLIFDISYVLCTHLLGQAGRHSARWWGSGGALYKLIGFFNIVCHKTQYGRIIIHT